jgi:hypothetical protein
MPSLYLYHNCDMALGLEKQPTSYNAYLSSISLQGGQSDRLFMFSVKKPGKQRMVKQYCLLLCISSVVA